MKRATKRRSFLAALGAGASAVAGCMGIGGGSDDGQTSSAPETDANDGTETATPGDDGNGGNGGSSQNAFSRGEVVEDFEFEKFQESSWGVIEGNAALDGQNAHQGSQSLRLENKNGRVAGVFRAFPDGLDLTKHDLTLAAQLEKPAEGRIAIEVLAPGRSDMLTCRRYINKEFDGWLRFDVGYTGKTGNPDLKHVQEIRIVVESEQGTPIRFWIDDLRKIKKPDKGKVIFTFDDNHVTQYDVAFKEFQKRNWPGGVAVIPDTVGGSEQLDTGQLREMRDAGWDIMSHPQTGRPLPEYPKKEQEKMITEAKRYLELKGFEKGSRHFVTPYHRINGETLELLQKHHETGFLYAGCPNNAEQPSGMHTISRILGRDPQGTRRITNLAAEFNQLAVVTYHDIGNGQDFETSPDDFRNVVNHVANKDVDVVAPSALLD
ncbi:polysaccharide deacetylase family protein [Halegenticoccus soli]|uniref:polysaccharide deacetylase family protein n=1 Tax=Halegenticoccus soli TaxID=1985678 RepID=UPI000C6D0526|nr:polysaccharide deacetylase family protein [Halegenticoccus soli]